MFSATTPESGLNVSVDIHQDTLVEGTEVSDFRLSNFFITSLNNENAPVIGRNRSKVVVIVDDDGKK